MAQLTIESEPEGAVVIIDGIHCAGQRAELAQADVPLSLELSLEGRRTTTTRFVPDRDQTLRISLPRAGRAGRETAPTTPPLRGIRARGARWILRLRMSARRYQICT